MSETNGYREEDKISPDSEEPERLSLHYSIRIITIFCYLLLVQTDKIEALIPWLFVSYGCLSLMFC